jgi:HAMP domain-containing protein
MSANTAISSQATPSSQSTGGGGGGVSSPALNLDVFEHDYFNADTFVKKIAAESVYSSSIADTKEKLNRSAQQTAEEIKQSVYKNYTNFMDTAKEVGHLEGKMNQMRQSLDEQRKLLNLFTNLNINSATNNLNLNDATNNAAKSNDK